jgi:hypothetical protein
MARGAPGVNGLRPTIRGSIGPNRQGAAGRSGAIARCHGVVTRERYGPPSPSSVFLRGVLP